MNHMILLSYNWSVWELLFEVKLIKYALLWSFIAGSDLCTTWFHHPESVIFKINYERKMSNNHSITPSPCDRLLSSLIDSIQLMIKKKAEGRRSAQLKWICNLLDSCGQRPCWWQLNSSLYFVNITSI